MTPTLFLFSFSFSWGEMVWCLGYLKLGRIVVWKKVVGKGCTEGVEGMKGL